MPRGRSNKSSTAFQAGELDDARRNAEATRQQLISAIERHPKHRSGDKAWTDYHRAVSNAEAPGEIIVMIPPPAKGFFMGSTKPERQQVEQLHSDLQTIARRMGIMQEVKYGENRRSAVAATATRRAQDDAVALASHQEYETTRGSDGLLPEERREQTRLAQQKERNRRDMEQLKQRNQQAEEDLVARILENNLMTYEQFMELPPQEQTKLRTKQINEDETQADQQQGMTGLMGGKRRTMRARKMRTKSRRRKSTKKNKKSKRKTRRGKKHQKKRTKRRR